MKTNPKDLALISEQLNEISTSILCAIRTKGLQNVFDYKTEHCYRSNYAKRVAVRKELIEPWRNSLLYVDINVDDLSVELLSFHSGGELSVHYHSDAYAVITFLGEWEGVPEPDGAFYVFGSKNDIHPVVFSKITLQVTPGTLHDFHCLDPHKDLYCLSVQSKRIDQDYHRVNTLPE